MARNDNTPAATVGFEAKLWAAAYALRNNINTRDPVIRQGIPIHV